VLGEKLGPTLFQCPPSLRVDLSRLREFLARIPRTWRAAFEFRHESWYADEVYAALREHDVALVTVDDDEGTTPLLETASWGYLRLRRTLYDSKGLAAWAERIRARRWSEAFVFLKHEEEDSANVGAGPESAVALAALVAGTP